jgi:hypothetical protein
MAARLSFFIARDAAEGPAVVTLQSSIEVRDPTDKKYGIVRHEAFRKGLSETWRLPPRTSTTAWYCVRDGCRSQDIQQIGFLVTQESSSVRLRE